MARRVIVPVALCGLGAALLVVPAISPLIPSGFSSPFAAFWLVAWSVDARFTARHWQLVMDGRESNVLVRALAKIAPRKPAYVFAAHAAFSIGAAVGLQALVTNSLDYLATSCILAVFGALHIDAFHQSRAFVARARMEQAHSGKNIL